MGRYRISVDVCEDDDKKRAGRGLKTYDLHALQKAMVSAAKIHLPDDLVDQVRIVAVNDPEGGSYHVHRGDQPCNSCYVLAGDGKDQKDLSDAWEVKVVQA